MSCCHKRPPAMRRLHVLVSMKNAVTDSASGARGCSILLSFPLFVELHAAAVAYTQQHPVSMTTNIMVAFILACGPHQDRQANIKQKPVYSPHPEGVIPLLHAAMLVASLSVSLESEHF